MLTRRDVLRLVPSSALLTTARAAQAAHKAHHEGKTLREACLELKLMSAEDFDRLVRPETMLGPM